MAAFGFLKSLHLRLCPCPLIRSAWSKKIKTAIHTKHPKNQYEWDGHDSIVSWIPRWLCCWGWHRDWMPRLFCSESHLRFLVFSVRPVQPVLRYIIVSLCIREMANLQDLIQHCCKDSGNICTTRETCNNKTHYIRCCPPSGSPVMQSRRTKEV